MVEYMYFENDTVNDKTMAILENWVVTFLISLFG